ncbi:hypothetical protein LINPERPRIM_LOCUS21756 [Linum perenne]
MGDQLLKMDLNRTIDICCFDLMPISMLNSVTRQGQSNIYSSILINLPTELWLL